MARTFGAKGVTTNYEISVRKPLDARLLVPSYEDLTSKANWLKEGSTSQIVAYNGMIVAVANTVDTAKNGVYMLFDAASTNLKAPNVTAEANWHKLVDFSDLTTITKNIEDEASARAIADSILESKIADALQAAKDYADENDIDTIYNDAELRQRIEAIERDYLKEIDKYDDTALVNRISIAEAKVAELVSKDSEHNTAIEAVKAQANKNEADIAKIATSVSALDNVVGKNTAEIAVINKAITALQSKDAELAIDLQQASAKIDDITNIIALKANASDVYTKDEANLAFMTQAEVDERINTLIFESDPEGGNIIDNIKKLVEYVDENAGDIATLVENTQDNTAKLAGIVGTVQGAIAEAINSIAVPKASDEVTIDKDGTLGLGKVSTDKLVQGANTLVLDGGSAA